MGWGRSSAVEHMLCVREPGLELPAQNKGGEIISYGQESTMTHTFQGMSRLTLLTAREVSVRVKHS